MKIEIDLNDILGDEYGSETLQESVKRQVIDNLTSSLVKKIGDKIDMEINESITKIVDEQLLEKMPSLIDDLWNMEYKPISRYGVEEKEKTTLKNELIKKIEGEFVYKKTNWQSDKNMFTKAVDFSMENALKGFKEEFNKEVSIKLKEEAFEYALNQFRLTRGKE